MKMVSFGSFPLFAPGVLLLHLFLLATTTTTTLVQPVGAIEVYSSEDLSVACGPQMSACHEDETCTSCSTVGEARRDEYASCSQAAAADGMDSSTVYCFDLETGVCCLDKVSENDCLANESFVEYWLCALEAGGCWGDAITCGYGSVSESESKRGGGGGGAAAAAAAASLGEPFSSIA